MGHDRPTLGSSRTTTTASFATAAVRWKRSRHSTRPDACSIFGTFSKVLFPTLRLGYVVAPPDLVDPLLAMRRVTDLNLPILEQLALADFIQEGHFARHLRRMRDHYRQRRDLLCHELRTHLGGLLEVQAPEAGMQVVGWLPPGKDDRRAAALAATVGILVHSFSWCSLEPLPRGGLVFGFASTDEAGLRQGVRNLAAVLDRF